MKVLESAPDMYTPWTEFPEKVQPVTVLLPASDMYAIPALPLLEKLQLWKVL